MKRSAPSALRNRQPIADILADELPGGGTVLEIASGSGEHVVHFAARFPALHWQPSDPDGDARASISAWAEQQALGNVELPLALDVAGADWPVERAGAIVCINMVHISPVAASEGLMRGAGHLLAKGAPLILYGPYLEDDVDTAASNLAFDASLKSRNPEWGIRQISWMDGLASQNGFARTRRVEMPANNLLLVYRKES